MATFFGDRNNDDEVQNAGTRADPRDDGNRNGATPNFYNDNYYWFDTGVVSPIKGDMVGETFNPNERLETDIAYRSLQDIPEQSGWNEWETSNVFTEDQVRKYFSPSGDAGGPFDDPDEVYRIAEFTDVNVLVTYRDDTTNTVPMKAMRIQGQNNNESLDNHWLIRVEDGDNWKDLFGADGSRSLVSMESFEITSVSSSSPTSIIANAFDDPLACYTAGTMLKTARGLVPVEEIVVDDRIYAMEKGWLPVIWVGKSTATAKGSGRGVFIPKGLFGLKRDTTVSLQHGMVLEENGKEYLLPAKWLADEGWGGCRFVDDGSEIEYYHLLLPQHAVIEANAAKSESFYPGVEVLKHLSGDTKEQIFDAIPGLDDCISEDEVRDAYGPRARPVLGMKAVLRAKAPMADGVIAA